MIRAYRFIDIIIRRDALEKKEEGLSQKFIEEYKVDEQHYDEDIICIRGGMNPYDVETEVIALETKYGLVFNSYPDKSPQTDIVIVEPFGVTTRNCWLKCEIKMDNGALDRIYYLKKP